MDKDTRIPEKRLKEFARALLAAGGFAADEAGAVAGSLVLSETAGYGSHGVIRIKEYLRMLEKGDLASGVRLRIVRETPASLMTDAQNGPGQVVMPEVLQKLYAKLPEQAVVSATVCNCGHVGRLGEWVEGPARKGYPGLLLVNGNGQFLHVAPPGGRKGVTDTNPIAFAVPLADESIFITDMSTSAVAFGKVRLARLAGAQLPPGCIQDAEGRPATDPEAVLRDPKGSMLPMGGAQAYKGFALSMLVDLLVAGLSGGQTPPAAAGAKGVNNVVLTLWNPEFFAGLDHMRREAKKYMDFIRASPPVDPARPIRLAGDRMNGIREDRARNGIPLNAGLVKELSGLAAKLGVAVPAELAD